MKKENNLCKSCIYRFRRVCIPLDPKSYIDEKGESIFKDSNDDNILIFTTCLISDMDIQDEETIECSHYKSKESIGGEEEMTLFKDIRFNK